MIKTMASLPPSDIEEDCYRECEMAKHVAIFADYY